MKKKVLSLLLASAMVLSLAACGDNKETNNGGSTTGTGSSDVVSSVAGGDSSYELTGIKIMVDGTLNLSEETGLNEFEKAWEDAVGIDLTINKVDHSGYADALARALANTGDRPDVVLMSAQMYAQYAAFDGFLWDMTSAYENSDFYSRLTKTAVNENNKINGKLLGFSPAIGNVCVTYIKQSWLDNLGVDINDIKTFDDYYNLLLRFKNEDPDGDGVNGQTYGVIAAGIISKEAPWTNYLPEFWQNAYPGLMQDENGTWVDGFQSEETKAALERLRQAWVDGVIDPDTSVFYGDTKKAREKWFSGDQSTSSGVFSYWAGTWRETLYNNLQKNGVDTDVAMLPKLAEMDGFLDRSAPVWVILDDGDGNNDREQAIWDAFFETMMDGDKVQTLWTYGVEDVHWSTKAETIVLNADDPDKRKETTYEEGEFHNLPNLNDPNSLYKKNHIDNLLAVAPLTNGFGSLSDMVSESNTFFDQYAIAAPAVPSSETYGTSGSTITDAVLVAVTSIVKDGVDYDTAMATYLSSCGSVLDQVLAELNAAE